MQFICGIPDAGALHAFRKAKAASYAVITTGPLALSVIASCIAMLNQSPTDADPKASTAMSAPERQPGHRSA